MSDETQAAQPPTRFELTFYQLVRVVVVAFCRLFWRLKVEGIDHVPATGSFILAPVHRSNVDSLVVAAATKRRMRYLGKREMWKYRASAWFFTTMGGIPVNRGTPDRDALRACEAVIARGEPLVMFPEGTRRSGPLVEDVFDGVAFVAARGGVPIVPVGIGGSEPAMPKGARMVRPVRIHMVIGAPLFPEKTPEAGRVPRRVVRELSEQLRDEMQRLFDEAEGG
ncbi:MAG: lysophospholipid acyltransferase family protein [Acidimicrobiales bacterium]